MIIILFFNIFLMAIEGLYSEGLNANPLKGLNEPTKELLLTQLQEGLPFDFKLYDQLNKLLLSTTLPSEDTEAGKPFHINMLYFGKDFIDYPDSEDGTLGLIELISDQVANGIHPKLWLEVVPKLWLEVVISYLNNGANVSKFITQGLTTGNSPESLNHSLFSVLSEKKLTHRK